MNGAPAYIDIMYFVHGTTEDNESGRATGWLPGKLSPLGEEQARQLGEAATVDFDVIISSDLTRAITSASLGFAGKCELVSDPRLRECNYGDWSGGDEKLVKADMLARIDEPFPHGESYHDVELRVRNLLDDVAHRYAGQKIAFMAHQAPQLALEVIVHGKTWQEAIETDWRRIGKWQAGWTYRYNSL